MHPKPGELYNGYLLARPQSNGLLSAQISPIRGIPPPIFSEFADKNTKKMRVVGASFEAVWSKGSSKSSGYEYTNSTLGKQRLVVWL